MNLASDGMLRTLFSDLTEEEARHMGANAFISEGCRSRWNDDEHGGICLALLLQMTTPLRCC
jgi:hypothetical protein